VTTDSKDISDWVGSVHLGDCLDVMGQMPSESVNVIVTSPPYNLKNSTGNGMKSKGSRFWRNPALRDGGYDGHSDDMPHDEYVAWQRACLDEMLRLLRPDGAIFYNHKWRVQAGLMQDRQDIVSGFPVRQVLIWERNGGMNFNPGYFLPNYEVIYLIPKPEFRLAAKANGVGCVWRFDYAKDNKHPAPFPFDLADRCVRSVYRDPEEEFVVLDPFMGSGTTAVAAIANEALWVGVDISEAYVEMAEARVMEAYARKEVSV